MEKDCEGYRTHGSPASLSGPGPRGRRWSAADILRGRPAVRRGASLAERGRRKVRPAGRTRSDRLASTHAGRTAAIRRAPRPVDGPVREVRPVPPTLPDVPPDRKRSRVTTRKDRVGPGIGGRDARARADGAGASRPLPRLPVVPESLPVRRAVRGDHRPDSRGIGATARACGQTLAIAQQSPAIDASRKGCRGVSCRSMAPGGGTPAAAHVAVAAPCSGTAGCRTGATRVATTRTAVKGRSPPRHPVHWLRREHLRSRHACGGTDPDRSRGSRGRRSRGIPVLRRPRAARRGFGGCRSSGR